MFVTTEDGIVYDVEMQVDNKKMQYLGQRSRFYTSEIDYDALRKGQDYKYLRQSYVIFICMFDPFGKGLPKYTFDENCHEDRDLYLDDKTTKIFINTFGDRSKMSKELTAVADYFASGIVSDKYTEAVDNKVKMCRNSERLEGTYMRLDQFIREERELAREDGRAEGRAEGTITEKIRTISRLFTMRLSKEDVAKASDLTVPQLEEFIKKHNIAVQ